MTSLYAKVVGSHGQQNAIYSERKRPAVSERDVTKKKCKSEKKFNLKQLTGGSRGFTRTNDEVHQTIDICPVMKAFIDTKQFQRLRHIKQLGVAHLVYACADHNRFQHSIGVSYLAREMCTRIKHKQHFLNTTDKDVLCVTLAGLLHDIGHGPFSHIYEAFRGDLNAQLEKDAKLKEYYDKKVPSVPKDWSHERSSLLMIDAALESLGLQIDIDNLDKPLKQIGDGIDANSMRVFKYDGAPDSFDDDDVLTSRDFVFIKECVFGKPIPEVREKFGNKLIGRKDERKEWLYDIVANRHNGLDVDKVDYFARDERRSLAQAGKINIQILYDALVAKGTCSQDYCERCNRHGGHFMICYPHKCVEEVMDFYHFRFKMHRTVYQHKTSTAATAMIIDAFKEADPHFPIQVGENRYSISSALINQEAFLKLKDSIIEDINNSTHPDLEPARIISKRIIERDLYKVAGELNIKSSDHELRQKAKKNPEEIVREICSVKGQHINDKGEAVYLNEEDVIVQYCSWHYGQKEKNPLSTVRFVNREELRKNDEILTAHEVDDEDYETIIPRSFMKQCIRVYSRDSSKTELLYHKFEEWKNLRNEVPYQTLNNQENDDTQQPVQLTQDDGDDSDMYTPTKNRIQKTEDPSPIPLPNFYFNT